MIITATSPAVSMRRLEWDSAHFGVPVAEIPSPDLTDDELRDVLAAARDEGVSLLYWATRRDRTLPPDLLSEFHGLTANHRVKFVAPAEPETAGSTPTTRGTQPAYRVFEWPRGAATRGLLDLSIVAGGHSRFQVDQRIPVEKFHGLYETWMTRSTLHELADVVLVAAPLDAADDLVGTITLSETAGAGQIGLLAVREDHRARGVATLLMTAAHNWLRLRGATELTVVTQLENYAACQLYSRWNCELAEVRLWFHFWPQLAEPR